MSTIASVFEEKDALYVETSAFKELKTIVEDKYWATILGKAGDGKSATAAHLLLYYQKTKGYQPSFLTSVRQWESLISSKQSTKQFVVIDDMFGSIVLDGRKTEEWLVEIEKMEKIVMKRKGDLMVVCTSRRHIFTDATTKLYKYSIFRKASIVDMTEKDFKLSNSEKVDIFKKYATRYEIGLNEETLTQIETIDSPHGFPHCVEMFCTNAFLRESGIKFFENPEEFVQKELHNFKDNDSLKFLVLLLVLYKRNRIHLRHFGEMVEHSDEEAEKLFKFTGIPLSTSYASMIKAVNALTNTYLTQTGDGYYTFTHESLKENVSRVYISLNSVHATKLLDFQQILTHVSKPTVSVKLPENELAERLTIELLSGNVDSVSTCASWQDPKFVDEWIRFVTITNESNRLQAGLLTSFLRRIFIPNETDDDSYDFVDYHQSSLITSLFENKMYNAVIAILNDKNIQKALGQDTLLECLEKGLEIVCRDVINISVVKDIVACQRTIRLTMLDGSEALCNALKTSDAETVLYLVKHTYILFDHDNVKSHISCLFQSSIDLASFKLLCPSLIPNGNTDGLLHDYIKMSNTKFCFKRFEYLAELAKDIDTSRSEAGTNIVELAIETLTAKQCICVLSILKKINANIEYVKKTSINGLHIICLKRNVSQYFDVLRYLVDAGVDPSHETDDGAVPLMFALQNDPGVDCLRWLLSVSPQRHTDKIGQGYFHYLLQSWCNFDILETYCNILLKACEDINLQDRAGTTPIMNFFQKSARHRQDSKDLTLFLAFLSSAEIDFHLTDNDGRNNLHYTFKAPGSLNAREQQEQDMYTISPQEDILHCPFQAPWSLDARELQEHYMYPISPHEDTILSTIFDFLVDKVNVDCFLADRNGVNPLMVALENYSVSKSVRKFLNRNIPDQTDKDGRTYFHYLDVSKEKLDQKVIGRVLHISSESEFDAGYDLMDLIAVSYANDTESDCYKVQTITESDIDLHFSELVVSLMNGLSASKSCT